MVDAGAPSSCTYPRGFVPLGYHKVMLYEVRHGSLCGNAAIIEDDVLLCYAA